MNRVGLVGGFFSFLLGQNVGIGTPTPTERLHVAGGNLRLDGAFMPGNDAGTNGALLRSAGPNTPPVWLAPGANGTVLTIQGGLPTWSTGPFWRLTGNTIAAGEFLGTLNDQPLVIRVNNTQTLQLNPTTLSIQRDAGGNLRGSGAVDLQLSRNQPTQVASGEFSVICGGLRNTASAFGSVVVGGHGNSATGQNAAIVGGLRNQATLTSTFVGGGERNVASINGASVVGGAENQASGFNSVVCGGFRNTAQGAQSMVGGGQDNVSSGEFSAIVGGWDNRVRDIYTTILGGQRNTARLPYAVVLNGEQNTSDCQYCFIANGANNTASGTRFNGIINGRSNQIAMGAGDYNTILNGEGNILENAGEHNSILGGSNNRMGAESYSTILTGRNNSIPTSGSSYELILGGRGHTISASEPHNSILNGQNGSILNSAAYSTILNGTNVTIVGGNHNILLGGENNTVNGNYVIAFGNGIAVAGEDRRVYLFTEADWGALVMNRPDNPAGYPIYVGTLGNGSNGSGAYLTGGGVWTNASSRFIKDRFQKLSPQEVLAKVRQLPVEGWYYKGTQEYHIGPYAEDFYEAFGTGVGNKEDARRHLAASDVAGVSLLSIQALAQQQDALLEELRKLREEVEALRQENKALRQALGHAQR
ncbi:MAG: hypothetical protein ABDH91_08895 [Bacteroidia bacterium]